MTAALHCRLANHPEKTRLYAFVRCEFASLRTTLKSVYSRCVAPQNCVEHSHCEKTMRRPAIFVIDMLNDCFGHAELKRLRASLCASINQLTDIARTKGFPVIWVRQEFEADLSDAFVDMRKENIRMFIKGTRGPLVLDELVRADLDIEIVKKRYSMFYGTDLESLLEDLQIDSLILAGVNSHACIRTSAIDAYQRDFPVTIVRECVASKDVTHHEVTMDYLDGGIATVVALGELGKQFGKENFA